MSIGNLQVMSNFNAQTNGAQNKSKSDKQSSKVSGFQTLLNELGVKKTRSGPVDVSSEAKQTKKMAGTSEADALEELLSLLQSLQQNVSAISQASNESLQQQVPVEVESIRTLMGKISAHFNSLRSDLGNLNGSQAVTSNLLAKVQQMIDSIQKSLQGLSGQNDIAPQVNQIVQSIRGWAAFGQNFATSGVGAGSSFFNHDNGDESLASAFAASQKSGSAVSIAFNLIHDKHTNQMDRTSESNSLRDREIVLPFTTQGKKLGSDATAHSDSTGTDKTNRSDSIDRLTPSFIALQGGQAHNGTNGEVRIPADSFTQHFGQLLDEKGLTNQNAFLQSSGNGQEFRIKLIPEGMGEVHVLIQAKDNGVAIQFAASSEQARHVLEAQSGELRDQLSARGIQLDQVQVSNLPDTQSFAFSQSDQQSRSWANQQQKAKHPHSKVDEIDARFSQLVALSGVGSNQQEPPNFTYRSVIDTTA